MKGSNLAVNRLNTPYSSTQDYKETDNPLSNRAHIYSLPFNYNEASDEILVELYVLNNDEEAFNQIVNRYNDIIMGFAMKMCQNSYDAEEVKQDVFLILVTKLHTFKGNSKFSTWLYRVTINTCYKYLNDSNKRNNKEVNIDESILEQNTIPSNWAKRPDEAILHQERMNVIGSAINELTESNKTIFKLKDIKGFSNAEVGEFMGLSISAVKSRVLRTRLTLKEKISEYF